MDVRLGHINLDKRTRAHVAIEREIDLLTLEQRRARCVTEAPDFVIVTDHDDPDGPCNIARWTDRVGGKRGLKLPITDDVNDLVWACLRAMLFRDLP